MKNSDLFIIPNPVHKPIIRLFCFPFAGGSAATYIPWIEHFDNNIEIVLIQPPGRTSRMTEPAHQDMDSVIDELIVHAPHMTDTPYVFFGHSLGSCVAFALTQRLQLLDFPLPQHLIASGSKAPHLEHEEEKIHDLPHHEFLNRLEKFNGTPKEILSDTELMEVLIPLLRSDFKISYYYQAKPIPIACPILIMGGDDDPVTNHERLTAWKELFTGKSEVIYVPGGHFFINQSKIIVIKKVQKVIFQVIKNNVSLPNLAQPENYA